QSADPDQSRAVLPGHQRERDGIARRGRVADRRRESASFAAFSTRSPRREYPAVGDGLRTPRQPGVQLAFSSAGRGAERKCDPLHGAAGRESRVFRRTAGASHSQGGGANRGRPANSIESGDRAGEKQAALGSGRELRGRKRVGSETSAASRAGRRGGGAGRTGPRNGHGSAGELRTF